MAGTCEHRASCVLCASPAKHFFYVGGQSVGLCEAHHRPSVAVVARYEDLGAFFAALGTDRRRGGDRRQRQRREFPPRPEGRRQNDGRRAEDRQW
ncbi:MAG: hypothetical protein AAGA56_13775 [Myxococcota bacterium]